MKTDRGKSLQRIIIRYLILLLFVLFASYSDILYKILLKATIIPVNAVLNLFYSSFTAGNMIITGDYAIELIPACIAISAYLLLIIINLSTNMSPKKRIYSLLFSIAALLILNITRIIIFSALFEADYQNFELLHKIVWYFFSIGFVAGVWFLTAYVFKIKGIPVYSDIKTIIKEYKIRK